LTRNGGAGQPGSFSASVTYAIEAFGATSGQLLAAAVNRRFHDRPDIATRLSTIEAAQAGIDDGATQFPSIVRLRKGSAAD
jgi:hypothetical protein